MNRCVVVLLGLLTLFVALTPEHSFARRGNPATNSSARLQFYIVDSDDDHARAPDFAWVDTAYNRAQWTRITGFTNNDDGVATVTPASTMTFQIPAFDYTVPRGAVSTNGTIALLTPGRSIDFTNEVYVWQEPTPRLMPLNNSVDTFAVIAALWGDWELRTTGDSSKVFYRVTTDTAYISYYDLALKGTEGKVRATFQIVFTKDSAITIHYKSFDGSFAGRTAEEIIQRNVGIGLSGTLSIGTNYLHRGTYYATSTGSAVYAKDLHDALSVRFMRARDNHVSARSITFPSNEKQELSANNVTFSGTVTNWTDNDHKIYLRFDVKNLTQDKTITTKTDSVDSYGGFNATYDGPTYQGLPCGEYEVSMRVWIPKLGDDPWTHDNTIRKRFYVLTSQNFPFYEQFNDGLSGCTWANIGAEVKPAKDVMYDPVAPRTGSDGALVLDRTDMSGRLYPNPFAGDTLTSAPINLQGKSNVYLNFSYQRGLKTDPIEAGTQLTLSVGPEASLTEGGTIIDHPDTLVVEGLLATGAKWNPSAASWQVLQTIVGGLDLRTQKVRLQLPSNMISDHFRLRFRMKSRENNAALSYPHDDNDSYVIDGIQIISPQSGQTEFEITSVDLGVNHHTRIPRDVRFVRPRVTINNNGRNAGLASYAVRMIITDQLNREVYHKSQSFAFPNSFGDTTISMLDWDIKGSQGGVFNIKTFVSENFSEIYRANDTNMTTRSLAIADVYGVDDGVPDTVGALVRAPLEWYYDFLPLTDDSIRGVDLFFLEQQGPTSWTLEFRRENVLLGTRSFSVTPFSRGWIRASFNPLHLPSNDTLTIHVTQTGGQGIGGDASRGLLVQTSTTPTFTIFYPEVVNEFRLANNLPFYDTTAAVNGGVLIPMMRLVFSGSAQYLPVELIRFTGKRVGSDVELIWKTASEKNSAGFTVERSFGNDWEFVASVPSRNSLIGAEYFAQDRMVPNADITYRLTERDLDGSTRALGKVRIGEHDRGALDLTVYPNPAKDIINLYLSESMPERVTLRDALGREVLNAFGIDALNVTDLPAGVYFLVVEANGETLSRSVTIAR